jgi:hypothetical protein
MGRKKKTDIVDKMIHASIASQHSSDILGSSLMQIESGYLKILNV